MHVADIARLSDHTVHVSGLALEADVLICGTGWKDAPQLEFLTGKELGLPGHVSASAKQHIPQAESEILKNCPKLQHQPAPRHIVSMTNEKAETTPDPYRLYRFMVPLLLLRAVHLLSLAQVPEPRDDHYRPNTSTLDYGNS